MPPRYPNRDESQAIIIGTSEYDNCDPLPAVANNLDTLRSIFVNAKRGGFLAGNCHTIRDPRDPRELAKHVRDVASQATDVLLVYCSGHGIIDPRDGTLQLALKHTNISDLHYTAFPVDLIKQAIRDSHAAIKIFILECCWSGRAITGTFMGGAGNTLQKRAEISGVCTLTSSPADEESLAPQGATYTAFSGEFIRLLSSAPDDHPAGATLGQMYRLLSQALQDRGYPAPQRSVGNSADDLALVGWDTGDFDPNETVILSPPSLFDDGSGQSAAPGPESLQRLPGRDVPTPEPLSPDQIDQQLADLLRQARTADDQGGVSEPGKTSTTVGAIVTKMIPIGGPEHPYVLCARDIECYWMAKNGRIGEARDQLARILQARTRICGSDHLEVLNTRQYFAHLTGLAGDPREAVEQFQQLTEDRIRICGRNHSDTLVTIDFLAYWTGVSGNFVEAVTLYQDLLSERAWMYGATDVRTLDTQEKLGDLQRLAGNNTDALDTYGQLLLNWNEIEDHQNKNQERIRNKRDCCADEGEE